MRTNFVNVSRRRTCNNIIIIAVVHASDVYATVTSTMVYTYNITVTTQETVGHTRPSASFAQVEPNYNAYIVLENVTTTPNAKLIAFGLNVAPPPRCKTHARGCRLPIYYNIIICVYYIMRPWEMYICTLLFRQFAFPWTIYHRYHIIIVGIFFFCNVRCPLTFPKDVYVTLNSVGTVRIIRWWYRYLSSCKLPI